MRNLTLLDRYVITCESNKDRIPVCQFMATLIERTKPCCHKWSAWSQAATYTSLPDRPIVWPDPAFCLEGREPVVPDPYRLTLDVGHEGPGFDMWFRSVPWSLAGVLVYQFKSDGFDVVPLVIDSEGLRLCTPDVHLRYQYSERLGWLWGKADGLGVNTTMHNFVLTLMPKKEQGLVIAQANDLALAVGQYLGAYAAWLNAPGTWIKRAAIKPRVKEKHGEVHKVYFSGSIGYKEYEH